MKQFSDLSEWALINRSGLKEPDEAESWRSEGNLRTEVKGPRSGLYGWESPALKMEPGAYYRLALRCRSDVHAFWEAQFCCEDAPSDDFHTAGIPSTSGRWKEFEYCFLAKHDKTMAHVILWPGATGVVEVADLSLKRASKDDTWKWFQRYMDLVPGLPPAAGVRFGEHLPATLRKLREGKAGRAPLNIATYGDSIAFDVGNVPLDLALEQAYPRAHVHMHTRGVGSSGWVKLGKPDVLASRLLAIAPDLVIMYSISNSPEDVRPNLEAIIDRVRAEGDTEFLLFTDHKLNDAETVRAWGDRFVRLAEETRAVGERKGCEVADFRALLEAYLPANKPPANDMQWLLRDSCHFNERGRAVVLKLMMRHLSPQS
jgi:hypothetical protein